jgi:hypothetical protein
MIMVNHIEAYQRVFLRPGPAGLPASGRSQGRMTRG